MAGWNTDTRCCTELAKVNFSAQSRKTQRCFKKKCSGSPQNNNNESCSFDRCIGLLTWNSNVLQKHNHKEGQRKVDQTQETWNQTQARAVNITHRKEHETKVRLPWPQFHAASCDLFQWPTLRTKFLENAQRHQLIAATATRISVAQNTQDRWKFWPSKCTPVWSFLHPPAQGACVESWCPTGLRIAEVTKFSAPSNIFPQSCRKHIFPEIFIAWKSQKTPNHTTFKYNHWSFFFFSKLPTVPDVLLAAEYLDFSLLNNLKCSSLCVQSICYR